MPKASYSIAFTIWPAAEPKKLRYRLFHTAARLATSCSDSFLGHHGWRVFYRHGEGDTLLPEGLTVLQP